MFTHHASAHSRCSDDQELSSSSSLNSQEGDKAANKLESQVGSSEDLGKIMRESDGGEELFRVVGDQSRSRHLRKELSRGSENQSVKHLLLAVFEQTSERGRLGRMLVDRGDGSEDEADVLAIGVDIVYEGNDLSRFGVSTFESEPSR